MDSLPPEILRHIFQNLPYGDLKLTIPLVCRTFRTLLTTPSKTGLIDQLLFRDEPIQHTVQSQPETYTVHPIFSRFIKQNLLFLSDVHYNSRQLRKLRQLCDENAVSPAVTSLILHVDIEIVIKLGNDRERRRQQEALVYVMATGGEGSGVSVLDVMTQVVEAAWPWVEIDETQGLEWRGVKKLKVDEGGRVHVFV